MNNIYRKTLMLSLLITIFGILFFNIQGCSKSTEFGIGPVDEVKQAPFSQELSDKGKKIFEVKCFACHRVGMKLVGPDIKGVTNRHKPEWIMNMMLNPAEMTQKNPEAIALFSQFKGVQMIIQGGITPDEARAVYEYLRFVDGKK
jgi:mono/diheme cytochrome c family protein